MENEFVSRWCIKEEVCKPALTGICVQLLGSVMKDPMYCPREPQTTYSDALAREMYALTAAVRLQVNNYRKLTFYIYFSTVTRKMYCQSSANCNII